MKKSVYIRGKLGTVWYNFTETLAYAILHRKTPESCEYTPHVKYGSGRQQFLNLCSRDWLRYEAFDLIEELEKYNIPHGSFLGDGIIGNHAWPLATIVKKGRQCFDESFEFVTRYVKV